MNNSNIFRFSWLGFGSIGILLAIITFFTLSTINKQEDSLNSLLAERGIGFINVYERLIISSVYSGLPLDLPTLTANLVGAQSFKYTMVVDEDGVILLHNDQEKIGEKITFEKYSGPTIHYKDITTEPVWRIISYDNQDDMIVYKRFGKPRRTMRQPIIEFTPLPNLLMPQNLDRLHHQNLIINRHHRDSEASKDFDLDPNIIINFNENTKFIKNFFGNGRIRNIPDNYELSFDFLDEYMSPVPSLSPISVALSQKKDLFLIVAQDMSIHNQGKLNSKMMIIFASLLISCAAIILIIVLQYVARNEAIQLHQAEKLLAIGDLTAGVAHEIRNPLSSIKGYATFFKQKFPEGSSEQEAASIMAEEVDRLNRAIDNLVGLSRTADVVLEEVNITEVCTKICLLLESEASQRGIEFICPNYDTPEIVSLIDPDKLKQALLNLLLNAMESFDNTAILEKKIALSLLKKNRQVQITIADNGSGIPKEIRERIFDPYFTTKNQGTGLGLVMVKNIIDAHNGSLELISNSDNTGTTFVIHLPIIA